MLSFGFFAIWQGKTTNLTRWGILNGNTTIGCWRRHQTGVIVSGLPLCLEHLAQAETVV